MSRWGLDLEVVAAGTTTGTAGAAEVLSIANARVPLATTRRTATSMGRFILRATTGADTGGGTGKSSTGATQVLFSRKRRRRRCGRRIDRRLLPSLESLAHTAYTASYTPLLTATEVRSQGGKGRTGRDRSEVPGGNTCTQPRAYSYGVVLTDLCRPRQLLPKALNPKRGPPPFPGTEGASHHWGQPRYG